MRRECPKNENEDLILNPKILDNKGLSPAILSLVAAWNIVAYKEQGLPSSGALGSALRLRDMACTSSRPKYVGDLWPWQHTTTQVSWRRGQPRSRQTWNPSPNRELRWRNDCDSRAWSASTRDVVNSIGDAGSTRPGRMPTQVQVSKYVQRNLPVNKSDHRFYDYDSAEATNE